MSYSDREYAKIWREQHPEKTEETRKEQARKGGKYYKKHLIYQHTGLTGERNRIRAKHARIWGKHRRMIAPKSHIHHCWLESSSKYTCVTLVEADQHRHGIIDVIQFLEGKITLFIEQETHINKS